MEKDVVLAAALPDIISAVTIDGGGHKIDGNGGSFSVLKTTTASGKLTLNRATVTGGKTGTYGGGIYADSSATVTLINCTVSGNSAGSGGGIFADHATIILSSSATLAAAAPAGL